MFAFLLPVRNELIHNLRRLPHWWVWCRGSQFRQLVARLSHKHSSCFTGQQFDMLMRSLDFGLASSNAEVAGHCLEGLYALAAWDVSRRTEGHAGLANRSAPGMHQHMHAPMTRSPIPLAAKGRHPATPHNLNWNRLQAMRPSRC